MLPPERRFISLLTLTSTISYFPLTWHRHESNRPLLTPSCDPTFQQVRALVEVINSGIQPVQNLRVLNKSATLSKAIWCCLSARPPLCPTFLCYASLSLSLSLTHSCVYHHTATPEAAAEAKKEWAKYWIERGLVALEKMLETTAGTYCFGNDVTLAGESQQIQTISYLDPTLFP